MATRFCLSHAWPGPHCLLLSPGNRKGTWRPGRLQPCQESPGRPSSVPSGPPSSRGAAHGRERPWKHPQHPQQGQPQGGCGGQQGELPWAQPLLLQDCSSLQGSPGTASPAAPGAPAALPCSAGSSQLLQCPNPEMCLCHTSGRASTAGGSKPYNTTARHPSQAWRGWGEQGVHVINIKSATKKRHILYIFDPYTQEHNIHRTPRRSGDVVRRFLRDVAPLPAPPLCLPVPTEHQSPEVPPGWHTALQVGVGGVLVPCCACPAALGER